MLFNSHIFIFGYLPMVLVLFYVLGRRSATLAAQWLAFASLAFYSWWDWHNLLLLLLSITLNFHAGQFIGRLHHGTGRKAVTGLAIGLNLAILGYFKYAGFLVSNWNVLAGTSRDIGNIVLPLGISFFTFTQIAYLADTYKNKVDEHNFVHYVLFVTYFPHLIAGPILHHGEMMPQFARPETYRLDFDRLALGLTIFCFGLFKKTVLADSVGPDATTVFDTVAAGHAVGLLESWKGVLAYTLQIYYDFSGYSDMAIGLSSLFGIRLPINFYSPYRSVNIIEFWRRWHISLSRFLRDYLYIPLGGNRHGMYRRYLNLFLTMLLGGLWHGANWTFVIWGGLHGIYLAINHGWREFRRCLGQDIDRSTVPGRMAGGTLTLLAVMVAWVFFRADSPHTALVVIKGMTGQNGITLPSGWLQFLSHPVFADGLAAWHIRFGELPMLDDGKGLIWYGAMCLHCLLAPNIQQLFERHHPGYCPSRLGRQIDPRHQWQPNWAWLGVTVVSGFMAILSISALSEFIYFQF